jgi:MYXO-CTERM domain-containing protein
MLNLRRILALAMVFCLACGVSFAFTNLVEVPANTEPYSTDRPPWQAPPAPQGDITFFTVESEFKDACGPTTDADFSCTAAEPAGVCSGPSPIDENTNDGCIPSGCIPAGVTGTAFPIGDYAAVGTGFLGVGIPAIGANYFTDEWRYDFSPATSCVGFKVIGDLVGPVTVDCTFEPSGAVATITGSLAGVFVGGVAGSASITGVECQEQVDSSADLYGALQIGGGTGDDDDDDVPASGSWGMIALLGLLMVGSLFFMRRRVEA